MQLQEKLTTPEAFLQCKKKLTVMFLAEERRQARNIAQNACIVPLARLFTHQKLQIWLS